MSKVRCWQQQQQQQSRLAAVGGALLTMVDSLMFICFLYPWLTLCRLCVS